MAIPFPAIALHMDIPSSISSASTNNTDSMTSTEVNGVLADHTNCKHNPKLDGLRVRAERGTSIPSNNYDGSIDQDPTEWKPKIPNGQTSADGRPGEHEGDKSITKPARDRAAAAFLVQFDGVHPLMQRARDMDARKKRNSALRKGCDCGDSRNEGRLKGRRLRRYPFAAVASAVSSPSETETDYGADTDDEHGGHGTDCLFPPRLSSSRSVASSIASSSTETLAAPISTFAVPVSSSTAAASAKGKHDGAITIV
ncbi:hypothetical protein KEM54_003677 [Ascosphaera aggregata]|nr:hypothetical protein KEM54_003677 [Ascosphaera aggregata]